VFPLGDLHKAEVRELARVRRLPVAEKADSQEICFVPDNDYAAVVERRAPDAIRPGDIVDTAGRTLGRHHGVHHFTVGQRRGLGISAPAPLYVLRIDARTQTVVVGAREELQQTALLAGDVNWIAGSEPAGPGRADVQIRYRHAAAGATLEPLAGRRASVVFDQPQAAVTPGQAAVFYDADEVVGGGWIAESIRE
jgi:tRNA-specific 2-thiouridylase